MGHISQVERTAYQESALEIICPDASSDQLDQWIKDHLVDGRNISSVAIRPHTIYGSSHYSESRMGRTDSSRRDNSAHHYTEDPLLLCGFGPITARHDDIHLGTSDGELSRLVCDQFYGTKSQVYTQHEKDSCRRSVEYRQMDTGWATDLCVENRSASTAPGATSSSTRRAIRCIGISSAYSDGAR